MPSQPTRSTLITVSCVPRRRVPVAGAPTIDISLEGAHRYDAAEAAGARCCTAPSTFPLFVCAPDRRRGVGKRPCLSFNSLPLMAPVQSREPLPTSRALRRTRGLDAPAVPCRAPCVPPATPAACPPFRPSDCRITCPTCRPWGPPSSCPLRHTKCTRAAQTSDRGTGVACQPRQECEALHAVTCRYMGRGCKPPTANEQTRAPR